MGQCTKARLAWGFVIPQEKLSPLLQAFQQQAKKTDKKANNKESDEPPEPPAKKNQKRHGGSTPGLSFLDACELIEHITKAMKQNGARDFFKFWAGGVKEDELENKLWFTFYYAGEDDEGCLTYELDVWGRENCKCLLFIEV
ncbi:hypothetical protein K439DRAFT_1619878 [Ramaria rubella]|nr:hypothetical protein K439DRAFT_1619878 [Ramaria rubella]